MVRRKKNKNILFFFGLEHNSKINKRLSTTTTYNWAPVYVPHPSLSPKFYKLVQNIQMTSLDTNSSTQRTRSNEDSIDNDTCSITNEFDQVKVQKNFLCRR
jgi:hypothetical protein